MPIKLRYIDSNFTQLQQGHLQPLLATWPENVCGCYLVKFLCPPTSTNQIHTTIFVLDQQIYNETYEKIILKNGFSPYWLFFFIGIACLLTLESDTQVLPIVLTTDVEQLLTFEDVVQSNLRLRDVCSLILIEQHSNQIYWSR